MMFITGTSGFIGRNFAFLAMKRNEAILPIDRVPIKYNIPGENCIPTYVHDLSKNSTPYILHELIDTHKPTHIVHFAAESHVDVSIESPLKFVDNNVLATVNILEGIRRYKGKKPTLVYISTDEVYGDLPLGGYGEVYAESFMEHDPFKPSSPYSASKAAGEMFVQAYGRTWNIPYLITRSCNNYGPYQTIDKFLSKAITNLLQDKKVPLYGHGLNEREWIHVEDNCEAIRTVMEKGVVGEAYNIGSNNCLSNEALLKILIQKIHPYRAFSDFIEPVKDRLGHDLKYKVECHKLRELGWKTRIPFVVGLDKTIQWFTDNRGFWHEESGHHSSSGEVK